MYRHSKRALSLLPALVLLGFAGTAQSAEAPSCTQPQYGGPFSPSSTNEHVLIQANHVNALLGNRGLSTLSGSVRVSQNGRQFSSHQLQYFQNTQQLLFNRPFLFREPGFIISSGSGSFNLSKGAGSFNDSLFTLPGRASRGSAQRIDVAKSGTVNLANARYTTCSPGSNAWELEAGHLHLNRKTGLGTAYNALLRVGGIPVMYFPYLRFPIDGRRRTGFLFPTIGEGTTTGFDLRLPVYLNLAPNYDDTFTPRFMSQRGLQLNNQFRYLLPGDRGSLEYQYLYRDQTTHKERSFIHFQDEGLLTNRLGLNINFAQVSDVNYFSDFGSYYYDNSLAYSTTPYLPRGASLTYRGNGPYTVRITAQSYQPLTIFSSSNDRPYKLLPDINFTGLTANSFHHIRAGIVVDATNFERSNSIQGQRFYLDPYLRWGMDRTDWFASSRLDGTYTDYALSGPLNGLPSNPHRVLPEFSMDGGLRFERITTGGMLQTLEPQVFYLFVPYTNQSDLPVFDSGLPDFNFPALFARNLYTGEDRISNANQLTTVLTTRFIDPRTGLDRLTASFGQIYRFTAPKVGLPGVNLPSAGTSDFVADADYLLSRDWDLHAAAQWSPTGSQFTRTTMAVHYLGPNNLRVDFAYHFERNLYNQADIGFLVPIANRWHIASRLIYSFRNNRSLASFAGIEYDTCCWAVQGGFNRYITSATGKFSTGVLLQFTLKGLRSLGRGWGDLLQPPDRNLSTLRALH